MSAWSWGQADAVHVVLIARGAEGEERYWFGDLRGGQEQGRTITLPSGTEAVTIVRPGQARADLGRHRRDRWSVARPGVTSRETDTLLLRLRTVITKGSVRRAVRRQNRGGAR